MRQQAGQPCRIGGVENGVSGRIVQGLHEAGVNNPVFILEQLDRVESEASDALLDVLAPRAGPRSGTSTSRSRSICPRWCGS